MDDGKRHARAVRSCGVQTLADVLGRIVAAENGLLLPKASFARANVVVKDGARSYKRFILKSHMGGAELRIFTDGSVVRGLAEFDAMRRRKSVWGVRGQIHNAEIRQAALAFEKHEVGLEDFRGCEHDVRAIGNDLAPEFTARVGHRSGHESEGAPAGIRANVKHFISRIRGRPGMFRGKRTRMFRGERTGMMVGVIFMVVFARSDQPKFSRGLIGAQVANFAGRMTRDGEKKENAATRAFHCDSKALVGLLVEQGVWFGGAQNMPIEPVGALRRFVLDGVEQRTIVGGPGNTGNALEALERGGPGAQIFDL